ncbi:hypothetical protein PCASD_02699 [Puccinia coronata f. sp. avenae]|uniref:Uncharacterized protein n=2 Tax=Puccinia coronata f. sp. avenae TaxID=200324 RepID=A0A2N5VH16_9BASI|nr:hypothetical protein PCASD_02699 [Puccinia coronata f. sp. avenae]
MADELVSHHHASVFAMMESITARFTPVSKAKMLDKWQELLGITVDMECNLAAVAGRYKALLSDLAGMEVYLSVDDLLPLVLHNAIPQNSPLRAEFSRRVVAEMSLYNYRPIPFERTRKILAAAILHVRLMQTRHDDDDDDDDDDSGPHSSTAGPPMVCSSSVALQPPATLSSAAAAPSPTRSRREEWSAQSNVGSALQIAYHASAASAAPPAPSHHRQCHRCGSSTHLIGAWPAISGQQHRLGPYMSPGHPGASANIIASAGPQRAACQPEPTPPAGQWPASRAPASFNTIPAQRQRMDSWRPPHASGSTVASRRTSQSTGAASDAEHSVLNTSDGSNAPGSSRACHPPEDPAGDNHAGLASPRSSGDFAGTPPFDWF